MCRFVLAAFVICAAAPPVAVAARRNLASIILDDAILGDGVPRIIATHGRWLGRWIAPSPGSDWRRRQRGYVALGLLFDAEGDHDRAVQVWQLAQSEGLWTHLSGWAWTAGRPAQAIALRQRTIAINPGNVDNYLALAWLYSPGTGRTKEGIATYRLAATRAPAGSFDRALAEGRACRLEGNWPCAFEAFEKAVKLDPARSDARRLAAESATKLGKLPEAIAQLEAARRLTPADSAVAFELGNAYREAGQLAAASAQYSEATRIDRGNPYGHRGHAALGDLYVARGLYADAGAEFALAISASPGTAAYQSGLGTALEGQGKQLEAIEAYRRAVSLDPNDTVAKQALVRLDRR